jgi:flagellar assembly factor FliW
MMHPQVIQFPAGVPGFEDAHDFVLVEWGDAGSPFTVLRSVDVEGLEFLVAAPVVLFPDYAPELDDGCADALMLTRAEDALVLVIVTVTDRAEDATANLLAPIVVNVHTNIAAQVVLPNAPIEDLRRSVFAFVHASVPSA